MSNTTITNSSPSKEESSDILSVRPLTPISCGRQVVNYGVDTIHLSLSIEIENPSILQLLHDTKKEIQSGDMNELSIDLGKSGIFSWCLQRVGTKLYPYVLKTADITLMISTRGKDSQIPNAMVCIGSLSCNNDLQTIYRNFEMFCRVVGLTIKGNKVSRVDIFSDINVAIDETFAWRIKHYLTRANKKFLYFDHDELTGIQIGKSDIVARIYDKQAEMTEKHRVDKQNFFNKIWGLTSSDPVTRVEFQLRRAAIVDMLKETDFKSVMSELSNMWDYLTTEWLRHCAEPVDRKNKNQSRSVDSSLWQIVVRAFEKPLKKIVRNRKVKVIDITSLKKQARGIMLSIAAGYGQHHSDFFGIMSAINETVMTEIQEFMKTPQFQAIYENKQTRAVLRF